MEAKCSAAKTRHLAKVFQFLSRVGEDVYLIAKQNSLELQSMSVGETALAQISFAVNSFFSSYKFDKETMQKHQNELTQSLSTRIYNNGQLRARMNVKHLLMAFRLLQDIREFTIVVRVDLAKFCFVVEQENGIERTYKFSIGQTEDGMLDFDPDQRSPISRLICHPNTFLDSLKHLSAKQSEVRFELEEEKAVLESELEDGPSTTLCIQQDDFSEWNTIDENGYWISFTVKEFKAICQLLETLGCSVLLKLPNHGQPLYITNAEDGVSVKVNLTLAVQSNKMDADPDEDEEEESMVLNPPGTHSFQSEGPENLSRKRQSELEEPELPRPKKRSRPNSQAKPRFGSQKRQRPNSQGGGSSIFGNSQESIRKHRMPASSENLFASDDDDELLGDGGGTQNSIDRGGSQPWDSTQIVEENTIPSSQTQNITQKSTFYSSAKPDDMEQDSDDLFA